MMNEDMNVAKADAQQAAKHVLGQGDELFRIDMQRAVAFRRLDRIARRAVIEGRQDDEIDLLLENFEDFHHGQRIHADGHVLAVVFENAQGKDDRPAPLDRRPDLARQHQFVAQLSPARLSPASLRPRRASAWMARSLPG